MTFMAGDFERGEQLYESALRAFRELGEEPARPRSSIGSRWPSPGRRSG